MLEKLTYVLVSLTCCVALVAIIERSFIRPAAPNPQEQQLVNHTLRLDGVSYSQRNIVLAVSTHCHFCSESLPFYRTLSENRSTKLPFKLIVVAPEAPADIRSYLSRQHVDADSLVSRSLPDIGVSGTPTLLIVDHSGVVKREFVGKLSASREQRVMSEVQHL